jgi:hypothetical protein
LKDDDFSSAAAKDSFNFWQSHARIKIECVFGEMSARWGVFWRPLADGARDIICNSLNAAALYRPAGGGRFRWMHDPDNPGTARIAVLS